MSAESDAMLAAAPDRSTGAALPTRPIARHRRTRWLEPRRDIPVWAYRTLGLAGFASCLLVWAWLSAVSVTLYRGAGPA